MARIKHTQRTPKGRSAKSSKLKKKAKASGVPDGGVKKARRYKPRTLALRRIKRAQQSVDLCINKTRFARILLAGAIKYNCCGKSGGDVMRMSKRGARAAHEALEAVIIEFMQGMNLAAVENGRSTVQQRDFRLMCALRKQTPQMRSIGVKAVKA
jgi:histone H3/H4